MVECPLISVENGVPLSSSLYTWGEVGKQCSNRENNYIRPGKVDSLFLISHFLNLTAGGRSLFIIHYQNSWK